MTLVRFEPNRRGIAQVALRSPGIAGLLRRKAEAVKAAADAAANAPDGHKVESETGATRARAAVITTSYDAMRAEAERRTLTSSIDAARS